MSVIYRLRTLSFRNKFVIVAAVFLVFGLIGAITLSQQQQDTRSRAAGDITGDHPGDLVGDNFRVAGKVLGSIFGNQNQVSNGVQGGIYGTANSINGDVGGCINGDNNRVAGNVSGGVVGTNNIVTGTTGTGPCPNPSAGPTVTTNPSPTVTTAPTFAPTSTSAPTLAPSPTPTNAPTPTGTPVPTAAPTITIPPTATIPPANISISLRMLLHGIGQGGDSANPNGGGNPNPNRPQRQVTVEIYNTQNQLVLTRQGSVNYNQSAGNFTGIVELGSSFPAGTYTIKIKTAQFLRSLVPGIQNLSNGTVVLPVNAMVVGDVNSDNVLNILDYNIIMGCYSDLAPPVLCSSANAVLSDLDDDGATNQFDYNLFLRELTNRQGE